jgi:chemotaxis response regulator CheB
MENPDEKFPVVCIGGSAGALKPFCQLLEHLSPQTGVAVVIVNHMRRFETRLHQILPSCTSMPVNIIQEKLEIKPDQVFIVPSNRELYIEDHEFRLKTVSKTFGWPNVITLFLKSLASNWNGQIIAGIVSGLDQDGVEALHQIKKAGGITFAQKPESAEVRDMPENAIQSGWIDYVLTPEEMAKKIEMIAKENRL